MSINFKSDRFQVSYTISGAKNFTKFLDRTCNGVLLLVKVQVFGDNNTNGATPM